MKTELRIVKLIEPSLCLSCRFAATWTVELADGSAKRGLHCTRLLCDNFDFSDLDNGPIVKFAKGCNSGNSE